MKQMHPAIPELKSDFEKGKITRREFMRYAALLGMSAAAAGGIAGLPFGREAMASDIRRGGILKAANACQKIAHPSAISWNASANVLRQVAEYLTYTDADNISHPYLLESWAASDDLKTWTLDVRQNVRFNNGDRFTAEDVVFTFNQWLDKDVGSSMMGLVGGYLDAGGIEKVNDHQVVLHLKRPEIAVPEHLFTFPALVLNHRTFEGDFLRAPHGTGPYTLEKYKEGEIAVFKARKDYWQPGEDGKPLPYLDGMEFYDMGQEISPIIAALREGEIHTMSMGDGIQITAVYEALKNNPDMSILPVQTAMVKVLRMRVDKKPWDDNRVRMALKLCQHREKTLALAYFNQGQPGHDTHVAPSHPEYCPKPIPAYDPEKAKRLLAEAGYPNGIDVELGVVSEWSDVVRWAEILKQDAEPAGFRIIIKTMPASQYWEQWLNVDLGITQWGHRQLGTMVFNLAYDMDAEGKPVPWNETRWTDTEFSELLKQANATLDVAKRREIFCKLEDIQMTRGSIGLAYWTNVWAITAKSLNGVVSHPSLLFIFNDAWLAA